ncbi:MAG: ThuA domain-containing protein [Acidobacteria bacterium]|nr:ThuA domain-containing protein [Acidobacteriota bacterium]
MNKKISLLSLVTALLIVASSSTSTTQRVNAQSRQSNKLRLLYVTQSMGFRHQSLHKSEEIMEQLGHKHGFEVTLTQMAELKLTAANIDNYDIIVFYTTGELPLSDEQKTLLLSWVKGGKLFMGLHSATDTFYKWPEYGEMINGWFDGHPWTQETEVTIKVDDRTHPITSHLPESMTFKEEIYQLKEFNQDKVKVLVSLDTTKTNMTLKGIKAKQFPLVYLRDYGKGKVVYNALGHRPDVWTAEWYQTMIVNTIKWGVK